MAVETIDYEVCSDCGECYDTCPLDVYDRVGSKYYIAHRAGTQSASGLAILKAQFFRAEIARWAPLARAAKQRSTSLAATRMH